MAITFDTIETIEEFKIFETNDLQVINWIEFIMVHFLLVAI